MLLHHNPISTFCSLITPDYPDILRSPLPLLTPMSVTLKLPVLYSSLPNYHRQRPKLHTSHPLSLPSTCPSVHPVDTLLTTQIPQKTPLTPHSLPPLLPDTLFVTSDSQVTNPGSPGYSSHPSHGPEVSRVEDTLDSTPSLLGSNQTHQERRDVSIHHRVSRPMTMTGRSHLTAVQELVDHTLYPACSFLFALQMMADRFLLPTARASRKFDDVDLFLKVEKVPGTDHPSSDPPLHPCPPFVHPTQTSRGTPSTRLSLPETPSLCPSFYPSYGLSSTRGPVTSIHPRGVPSPHLKRSQRSNLFTHVD